VGDVRILTTEGAAWIVTGANGENAVNARERSQAEAWHRSCQQAEAAVMLRREEKPGRSAFEDEGLELPEFKRGRPSPKPADQGEPAPPKRPRQGKAGKNR
jgi:hypothetical protein